jgi:hypothetical protein
MLLCLKVISRLNVVLSSCEGQGSAGQEYGEYKASPTKDVERRNGVNSSKSDSF